MARAAAVGLVVLALGALGCIPRVPQQRLAERAQVAVVYVVDRAGAGAPWTPPEALKAAVTQALDARNLEVVERPLEVLAGQRLTDARLAALAAAAPDAPFVLLVEQRVTFFSQIDGRYRWEVGTSLTAQRRGAAAVKEPFESAVVLQFDHQREAEALAEVADDVSGRAGRLFDGLLAGAPGLAVGGSSAGPGGVYFVMVDRFENGDAANDGAIDLGDAQAFHGGDLDGLTRRLDWIASLGFDTVWLSPISRMRTTPWHGHGAFHGYWTWELSRLEPRFGDEASLRRLRAALDARGMKLVLDLVLNHVGPDAPLLQTHPDWFHHQGGVTDWSDARQLVDRDVHGLPDLATEKPAVYRYLADGARRWLRAAGA